MQSFIFAHKKHRAKVMAPCASVHGAVVYDVSLNIALAGFFLLGQGDVGGDLCALLWLSPGHVI